MESIPTQVYHMRDRQVGRVFHGGHGDDRDYIQWECGFIQVFRLGGFVVDAADVQVQATRRKAA